LAQADQAAQRAVLAASMEFWTADRTGASDPSAWQNMEQVLLDMGLLSSPVDPAQAYTNEFLP
jgi:hypothetical protein